MLQYWLDNVAFHHSTSVRVVSNAPKDVLIVSATILPLSKPHDRMSLLGAMKAGCQDILPEQSQGWMQHAKRYFPWSLESTSDAMVMRTWGQIQRSGYSRSEIRSIVLLQSLTKCKCYFCFVLFLSVVLTSTFLFFFFYKLISCFYPTV